MKERVLAERYAKALVDLGVEEKSLERFEEELNRFSEVLNLESNLLTLLSARELAWEKRSHILEDLMQKLILSPHVSNCLRLLMKRRRIQIFPEIVTVFEELVRALNQVLVAHIRVASKKEAQAELGHYLQHSLEKMTGKTVACELAEDPQLIGGIQIQIGDEIFDASIQGELERIRQEWIA